MSSQGNPRQVHSIIVTALLLTTNKNMNHLSDDMIWVVCNPVPIIGYFIPMFIFFEYCIIDIQSKFLSLRWIIMMNNTGKDEGLNITITNEAQQKSSVSEKEENERLRNELQLQEYNRMCLLIRIWQNEDNKIIKILLSLPNYYPIPDNEKDFLFSFDGKEPVIKTTNIKEHLNIPPVYLFSFYTLHSDKIHEKYFRSQREGHSITLESRDALGIIEAVWKFLVECNLENLAINRQPKASASFHKEYALKVAHDAPFVPYSLEHLITTLKAMKRRELEVYPLTTTLKKIENETAVQTPPRTEVSTCIII